MAKYKVCKNAMEGYFLLDEEALQTYPISEGDAQYWLERLGKSIEEHEFEFVPIIYGDGSTQVYSVIPSGNPVLEEFDENSTCHPYPKENGEKSDLCIADIPIVQRIKEWCNQGPNHCPNEIDTAAFVRELIPYLESLEERIGKLEVKLNQ